MRPFQSLRFEGSFCDRGATEIFRTSARSNRDHRDRSRVGYAGVVYCYAPQHARNHLAGFSGILQGDGYAAYKELATRREPGPCPRPLQNGRSHPLCDPSLGRLDPVRGRRPHRDGLEHGRARHQAIAPNRKNALFAGHDRGAAHSGAARPRASALLWSH